MLLNFPACGVGTLMLDGSKDTDDTADPTDDTAEPTDDTDEPTDDTDDTAGCEPGLSISAGPIVIDPYTSAWPTLTGCEASGITVEQPLWLRPVAVPSELDGAVMFEVQSQPGYQNVSGTITFTSAQGSASLDVVLGSF